jgi:hypothetical protein
LVSAVRDGRGCALCQANVCDRSVSSWTIISSVGVPICLFSVSEPRFARAPPSVLDAAYTHRAMRETSGSTSSIVSVERIDR